MTAVVRKNYIRYNGYRYYKARAQTIELADYGIKRTPATRANYLDQKGNLSRIVEDVRVTTFKLTQASGDKANVVGNFSMALFGLSGDDFYEQSLAGKWEFVVIHLRNEHKFMKALNRQRGRIERLKMNNDYRIVDSIIVVAKAKEVRKLRMGHTGAFNMNWNGIGLTVDSKTRTNQVTKFEVAPETVYAYGLKKIKWDKTRKERRSKIVDLKDDPHGP